MILSGFGGGGNAFETIIIAEKFVQLELTCNQNLDVANSTKLSNGRILKGV